MIRHRWRTRPDAPLPDYPTYAAVCPECGLLTGWSSASAARKVGGFTFPDGFAERYEQGDDGTCECDWSKIDASDGERDPAEDS